MNHVCVQPDTEISLQGIIRMHLTLNLVKYTVKNESIKSECAYLPTFP